MGHAERSQTPIRVRQVFVLALTATLGSGCAPTTAIEWRPPIVAAATPIESLVVMPAIVGATAIRGNIGFDVAPVESAVNATILAAVRERCPNARRAEVGVRGPAWSAVPGYRAATGEPIVPEEFAALNWASQHGATHLLVPTITQWTEMRTDDPIGALVLGHNRISITLRLMQLRPPALVKRVTFTNRARLTLNQPATRLLNGRFRATVLSLVSPSP